MGKFLVSLLSTLLVIPLAVVFISCILFVIFGQVTVRKLRKNPETKYELGIEFLSGWDIFNVAQALSLPKSVMQKIRSNPQGGSVIFANYELLYEHTTVFDRLLARLFCWSWMLSSFALILLMILDWIWGFD